MSAHLRRQRSLGGPPPHEPFADGVCFDPSLFCPASEMPRLPVKGDGVVVPLVRSLYVTRCPSAVLGLIAAIVIDALDGVLGGWARAHVSVEDGEVVLPLLADAHASASVVLVGGVVGVEAPLFDGAPAGVLRGVPASSGKTVAKMALFGHPSSSASARFHLPKLQAGRRSCRELPAVAEAQPFTCSARTSLHDQLPEALAT